MSAPANPFQFLFSPTAGSNTTVTKSDGSPMTNDELSSQIQASGAGISAAFIVAGLIALFLGIWLMSASIRSSKKLKSYMKKHGNLESFVSKRQQFTTTMLLGAILASLNLFLGGIFIIPAILSLIVVIMCYTGVSKLAKIGCKGEDVRRERVKFLKSRFTWCTIYAIVIQIIPGIISIAAGVGIAIITNNRTEEFKNSRSNGSQNSLVFGRPNNGY